MTAAGVQTIRLGEHILRVETAAVAFAAVWAALRCDAAAVSPGDG
jgi:16S rRNA U1498 N3-methylase RsmE